MSWACSKARREMTLARPGTCLAFGCLKNYVAKLLFSNIVLVFHMVRSVTASLRASATRAFQLPDRALSRKPHCFIAIVGDARYKITVAASNSSLRVKRSPVFDIRPPMSTSPD